MKGKRKFKFKGKILSMALVLCMVVSLMPLTALAANVNYIDKINVAYNRVDYKAGDTPQTQASVTSGNCTVAYEYWREIYQPEEGGVWKGTGCYWYSDPDKMAALSDDKKITQFEAGKHYSYNIVLVTNSGYFISDDTIVSVGDYEWGTAGSHTNLEIKELSTKLVIYSPYSIDIPADNTDQVITNVSVTNVNKNLDASSPVTFTAEAGSDSVGKFDVTEECWEIAYNESNPIDDVIKSTDTVPHAPVAGGQYWYSIVLTAKEGYVFSGDFSDSRHSIKEGSEVSFTLDGISYNSKFSVSDDGKTLSAWEFMDPVKVTDNTPVVNTINTVNIENATLKYAPGESPKAAATISAADSGKYKIVTECWEKLEKDDNDTMKTVAYWYSNESCYGENDVRFLSFENGVKYKYSVVLENEEGYKFADNVTMILNGEEISAQTDVGEDGKTFLIDNVLTMTPVSNNNPATPTPPVTPTPPADSADPATPTPPADSADPATPTPPADSANPATPTPPADSADPATPTPPADSADPATPTPSADSADPATPTAPADSATPANPAASTNTSNLLSGSDTQTSGTASNTANATETAKTGNTKTNSPKTGDNSNVGLWCVIMLIYSGGILGCAVYRRRKRVS